MAQRLQPLLGVIGLVVISLVLIGGGWSLINAGRAERRLAAAPHVALRDLAAWADRGRAVRVEARALGEPRLTPPNGQALALQYVRVEHTEGDDEDQHTVVDYEYVAPVELLIGDGRQTVRVRAQGVDPRFLQRQLAARLDSEGRPPAEVIAALDPIFNDLPAVPHGQVTIWNIPAPADVTVYGTVTLEEGQPVVQAGDDAFFVVSPLPFTELLQRATTSSRISLLLGSGMILVPVIGGLIWLIAGRRGRPRRKRLAMGEGA